MKNLTINVKTADLARILGTVLESVREGDEQLKEVTQ